MGGHGHVTPRPDGAKARCGGPGLCAVCSREQAALRGKPEPLITLERIVCPVDGCGWLHTRIPPMVEPDALASVFGVGVMSAVAKARELQETEQLVRQHMAGHTDEEYLRTITRLQGRVAELERAL